jgi:radical SAM protein with 4Fe4S-binding SPASM domain
LKYIFQIVGEDIAQLHATICIQTAGYDRSIGQNRDMIAQGVAVAIFNFSFLLFVRPLKLADHIFLQKSPRFEWPDEKLEAKVENRYCYALRDHIAILADGTIVPCCLDADGSMKLGNIFTDNLKDVLQSSKALNIKKGFEQRKVVEPLCATCGFTVE